MPELTQLQIQLLRSDIGDTSHPLFIHPEQLQQLADYVDEQQEDEAALRVYALRGIVSRMAHDRDPRYKEYNEMLTKWEIRANMTGGVIQTGIIDLNLIAPLHEGEYDIYGNEDEFG